MKHSLILKTIIASSLLCGAITFAVGATSSEIKDSVQVQAIGNYSTNASTYYNDITATSGTQLAAQLHNLITSTHRYYTSYADNGANGYQKNTDRYYENGVAQSGYIYEFYSGVKWPDTWAASAGDTSGGYNREHCWCQSNSVNTAGTQMWGETGGGADMHHLRPVEVRLNSTRSNNVYGELSNRDSYKVYAKYGSNATYAVGGYNSGGVFEPLDSKKGDVARIILYVYLHYNSYSVSTLFGSYGTTNGSGTSSYFTSSLLSLTKTTNQTTEAKALEMLLSWNASDPVDEIEQRRNEQVAVYQGNRNPFIDNSNYAEMIWGNGSSTTPTVNSVSVSPSTLNLDLNGTTTGNLTATVNVSNGAAQTVTWTSSNTNVATVSSSGVVTAVAKGSCTITATSTVNSNKTASCSVKVVDTSSSGGGGGSSTVEETATVSISTYATANSWVNGTKYTSISLDSVATASVGTGGGNTGKYYTSGNEWRFYQTENATIVISVPEGYTLESVTFTYNVSNTGQLLDSSNNVVSSGSSVSLTGTSATFSVGNSGSATNGQVKFTSISVTYSYQTSGGVAALSSISLNTSNVQTEFYVGDTFDYSGLVVTAHYDNGAEDTVTPTSVSSPNMSTAGNKTITVTYTESAVSKTATYTITVLSAEVTAIYASVNKTYHPGDTISTSDIYVEDNLGNEVTGFTFANNGYQFTYSDAPSGGSDGTKTFTSAVSYSSLTTNLEVTVNRINYVTPVSYDDTMNRSWTGVSSTQYTSWSGKAGTSGATYAGQSAGPTSSDYIQLRSNNSNSGIVTTAYSGSLYISSVTVSWNDGTDDARTLNIYGDTTAYTSPTELYGNSIKGTLLGTINKGTGSSLTITGNYQYIGIRSASGALYLDEIVVTYGVSQSPTNVANYIMYEDTNNQCTSKFTTAKGYFEGLTSSQRETFMTSSDYVISTARERLQAWAANQGKTISYTNNDYSISAAKSVLLIINNNSLLSLGLVLMTIGGLIYAGTFVFKKKEK